MSISLLVVLLSLSLVKGEEVDISMEEGVLVLGQDNFQTAIDTNSLVLVEFYAPWCGHCKKLVPEYAKAASILSEKNSAAKLAKVDATEHKELSQQFGVKGYPTLKFFKNGVAQEYTGGRTADTIVQWIDKKSGPAATPLANKDEANSFVADNKVAGIGFFTDPAAKEAVAFTTAADAKEEVIEDTITATQEEGEEDENGGEELVTTDESSSNQNETVIDKPGEELEQVAVPVDDD